MEDDKNKTKDNIVNNVIVKKDIPVNETKGSLYRIFLDTNIKRPDIYRDIYNTIVDAKDCDEIELVINTHGGLVMSTIQLYNALTNSKASTKAIIIEAYSAGSILALACKKVKIEKYGSMAIHQMQSGTGYGDTMVMLDRAKFDETYMKNFYSDVYKNFLSEDEFEQLYAGKEFWLHSDDISKRLKKINKLVN